MDNQPSPQSKTNFLRKHSFSGQVQSRSNKARFSAPNLPGQQFRMVQVLHQFLAQKTANTLWTSRNPIAIWRGPFRRSSAVEQLTVNQLVVGSIPTAGATFPIKKISRSGYFQNPPLACVLEFCRWHSAVKLRQIPPCPAPATWQFYHRRKTATLLRSGFRLPL